MRLIDADVLLEKVQFRLPIDNHNAEVISGCVGISRRLIETAPTIDAVPVVHGVWERSIDNDCLMHKCSVCGARVVKGLYEYKNPNLYCYHCGAKMDGERRSDD